MENENDVLGELSNESPKSDIGGAVDSKEVEKTLCAEGNVCLPKKFGTVEELAKAYENLEKEFTKKCQMLKDLEKQGDACEAVKESPVVFDKPENVRQEIIKEYLTSVAASPKAPVVISGQGDFAVGIKPMQMTLRDMEKVAENFFKIKEK
jgi:hypothetical protein